MEAGLWGCSTAPRVAVKGASSHLQTFYSRRLDGLNGTHRAAPFDLDKPGAGRQILGNLTPLTESELYVIPAFRR